MTAPRVVAGTDRPHLVEVHLTDEELAALDALALGAGLSRAGVLRQALRVYQLTVRPPVPKGDKLL